MRKEKEQSLDEEVLLMKSKMGLVTVLKKNVLYRNTERCAHSSVPAGYPLN
jgi:hypothetical protein